MALLHHATLVPSKLELLAGWLPTRPWFPGGEVTQLGAYRLDDPAGEVGLEAFLLQTGGDRQVLHVPLSYRAAPLPEGDQALLGTMEHSVLGTRWMYDGCADPVFAATLATTVLTGGHQAELVLDSGGTREPTVTVVGSGSEGTPVPAIGTVGCRDDGPVSVVRAGALELVVVRGVGRGPALDQTLTGSWPGGTGVLAGTRRA
jgi:hypothetical protein